ncbi:MAG: hypothetical protein JXR70_06535 [Spirochaetales bacterium]|nr:hypothetical protein [Spirochaetales bacterium]
MIYFIIIMRKQLILITVLIFLSALLFSLEGIKFQGGLTATFHGSESSAQMAIKPGGGLSFPIKLGGNLILEPALYISTLNVEEQNAVVVPVEVEQSDVLLLQFFVMAHIGVAFEILKLHQFTVMGSLAFIPSLPIAESSGTSMDAVFAYYYSSLRFIYPGIKLGYAWKFSENKSLVIDMTGLFPISNIWTGENIVNYLMVIASIGFLIHI